jgi:acetyltransferase
MLAGIQAAPLLSGVRGQAGISRAALTEILLRVSSLLSNHPEIEELDLNPVMAFPEGRQTAVVDGRIRLSRRG